MQHADFKINLYEHKDNKQNEWHFDVSYFPYTITVIFYLPAQSYEIGFKQFGIGCGNSVSYKFWCFIFKELRFKDFR